MSALSGALALHLLFSVGQCARLVLWSLRSVPVFAPAQADFKLILVLETEEHGLSKVHFSGNTGLGS